MKYIAVIQQTGLRGSGGRWDNCVAQSSRGTLVTSVIQDDKPSRLPRDDPPSEEHRPVSSPLTEPFVEPTPSAQAEPRRGRRLPV